MKKSLFIIVVGIMLSCNSEEIKLVQLSFDTFNYSGSEVNVELKEYPDFRNYESFNNNCLDNFHRSSSIISDEIKCSVIKTSQENPNNQSWPDTLRFEIKIHFDRLREKINSASLYFPDYNQNFDLTKSFRWRYQTIGVSSIIFECNSEIYSKSNSKRNESKKLHINIKTVGYL